MPRWLAEVVVATALACFGLVVLVGAREFGTGWSSSGPEPGAFPFYIGIVIVAASLFNAARAAAPALRPGGWSGAPFVTAQQARRVAGFAGPILALVVVSLALGLYVGMATYLFGTLVFQNRYALWKASAIALAAPLVTWLLIERAFKVGMLKGPIEAALGL
ncbi:MAG: tripartite tricarboxylate transporter TctB family protein [Methylobacteriaceae bacterium]|nr:tripartite tricarboxylate transporter TctB family protein [Methylobacteriaceae bacterium]